MLSSCSRTNGSDEIYTFAALALAALPGLAARAGGTCLWRSEAGSAGLDCKAPWFQIKEDRQAVAQKLHEYLGYDDQLFGAEHVVEHREEARSRQALTYDHIALERI